MKISSKINGSGSRPAANQTADPVSRSRPRWPAVWRNPFRSLYRLSALRASRFTGDLYHVIAWFFITVVLEFVSTVMYAETILDAGGGGRVVPGPDGLARLDQRCPAPKSPGPNGMGRHWGYCGVAPTRRALLGCPSPARLALPPMALPHTSSYLRIRVLSHFNILSSIRLWLSPEIPHPSLARAARLCRDGISGQRRIPAIFQKSS